MLEEGFLQILDKVYKERGLDFRQYKESSLRRRIKRRLGGRNVASCQEYLKVLDTDPEEYKRLADCLTIKVTDFFRNPEVWQILREGVLPEVIREKIKKRKENEGFKPVLRIWSAGCATGQEVYSMAILLDQLLRERKDDLEVIIWGTDIDKESLLKAQQAEYKSDMIKGVPQKVLSNHFDFNDNFKLKSHVTDMVYFKSHDLVMNEPLRHMDMILCRNVVIYFERPLQEKVFMDFYHGLSGGGYLFLGKAETLIGPAKQRFEVIDKRWRIYQKKEVVS